MHPCPTCACHVRRADRTCPHCGASLGGARTLHHSAAAAVLSLAIACTGSDKGTDTAETAETGSPTTGVDYGTSPTDTDTDTDSDTDTDTDTDTDSDTDTDTDTDTDSDTDTDTGPTTGVDYGSPTTYDTAGDSGTTGTVEPEYGASTTGD